MLNLFNNHHNGDVHLSRGIIHFFKTQYPSLPLLFSHNCSPRLTNDLCITAKITGHNQYAPTISVRDGVKRVNTWVCQPQNKGRNEISFYNLIQTLGIHYPELLKRPERWFPLSYTISKDACENELAIYGEDNRVKILVCNEQCQSLQHSNQDFSSVYQQLQKEFPLVDFFFTNKEHNFKNLKGVDLSEAIPRSGLDIPTNLPEISHFTYLMDIIVGGGSGPYEVAKTDLTLTDPDITFVSYSRRPFDTLWAECFAQCKGIWTNDNSFLLYNALKGEITNKINKLMIG